MMLISCAQKKSNVVVLPPQCGEALYNDMDIRRIVEPRNFSDDLVFSELATSHKDVYCGLSGDINAAKRAAHDFFVGSHDPNNISDKKANLFLEIAARQGDVEAQKLLHKNYYEHNGASDVKERSVWEYALFTHGYKQYDDFIRRSQEDDKRVVLRNAEYLAYYSKHKEHIPIDILIEKYGLNDLID